MNAKLPYKSTPKENPSEEQKKLKKNQHNGVEIIENFSTQGEFRKNSVKDFLRSLTTAPGVYQMLDQAGQIIYIGKAKNLKNRVSSYFQKNLSSAKTMALVKQIHDIRIIITHNENEALLLENNLIKQHKPRYNILFKDDKSYPYLIFSHHPFPRLDLIYSHKTPKQTYFGPFSNKYAVKQTLQIIEKLFLLRNCNDRFFAHRSRPCLQYQIKRCSAPCVNLITPEAYEQAVSNARLFLEGKNKIIIKNLTDKMDQAAKQLQFEQAARYRNQIQMLREIESSQTVQNAHGQFDVIASVHQTPYLSLQILKIREGKIIANYNYFYDNFLNTSLSEALTYFVSQFYLTITHSRPEKIFVQTVLNDQSWLASALSEQAKHKMTIQKASRGIPLNLMKMAEHNAAEALAAHLKASASIQQRLSSLAEALDIPVASLKRIECFDISHTFGDYTVASCVVFDQNGANKKEYRIFNIENVKAGDDFAAMHQVLERRYRGQLENDAFNLPDLILIDGGKGQLSQAIDVLKKLGLSNILLLGIAKGSTRKPGLETLFLGKEAKPLALSSDSLALHLLQNIRDEAHRFAITRHRQKRNKAHVTSNLENVPGIGSKKRQALLKYFGGFQGLQNASLMAINKAPGIGAELAQKIYQFLHP